MQQPKRRAPESGSDTEDENGPMPLGLVVAALVGRIAAKHQASGRAKKPTNGSHPAPAAYGPPERVPALGGPIDLGEGL